MMISLDQVDVDSASYETVRQVLKNKLKPWLNKQWVIPPKANALFVYRMEAVLDLYHQPYDPQRPAVCMDETTKQLVAETRPSIPAGPGRLQRYNYESNRNGVSNLFMFFGPLGDWHHVRCQLAVW